MPHCTHVEVTCRTTKKGASLSDVSRALDELVDEPVAYRDILGTDQFEVTAVILEPEKGRAIRNLREVGAISIRFTCIERIQD